MKGRTDLLEELLSKLLIGNGQILGELASEGLLLAPGSNLHECSYSGIAPVFFRCLLIILSSCIIGGLRYLLLKLAIWDKYQYECKRKCKASSLRMNN
jgi:hypothetical protein